MVSNVKTIHQSIIESRQKGAVFDITDIINVLEITEADHIGFLNNLLTIDISVMPTHSGRKAFILSPKATVIFQLWIFKLPERTFLLLPHRQAQKCKQYLEYRTFLEKVNIKYITNPVYYFEKKPPPFTTPPPPSPPSLDKSNNLLPAHLGEEFFGLQLNFSGEVGYIAWGSQLEKEIKSTTTKIITEKEVFFTLAYEGLNPQLTDEEFSQELPVMELPQWEQHIDFDKGCYPGQEIITRSRSRHQTPVKKYTPISLRTQGLCSPSIAFFKKNMPLKTQNLQIGTIISYRYSPFLKTEIAWTHLHKDFTALGQVIPLQDDEQKKFDIEIIDNPFIKNPNQKQSCFHKTMKAGLTAYHNNDFNTAKKKFSQAAEINPTHPDPWEAMSVIEEKTGNIDEAIRLNKVFEDKSPDSPLAKTNLSRLYMLKGWIEKAEEEKRKATVLMFKTTAKEKKLHEHQVQSPNSQAEKHNKKRIFQQVLDMDPNDAIANFGLGKLLFEEGQYYEAKKCFKKTISENPKYSLAYSFLAECLIKDSHIKEAILLLKTGIQHAREQGHIAPLKAMEQNLNRLS